MKELNLLKTFNYKTQMKWVFSTIKAVRATPEKYNSKRIREIIKKRLNEVENLTSAEVSSLVEVFYQTIKKSVYGGNSGLENKIFQRLYKECRKVHLRVREKNKLDSTRALLRSGFVFFMCSKHYPVAPDHKDYQGKLYVNQNWRNLVQGRYYRAVSEYIKNSGVLTIQSVMKNPPYLITRPNCRHKLVGVPTNAVLASVSGDEIGKNQLEKYMIISHNKRTYGKTDYYKEIKEECRAILNNSTE